jgi:hypothetical protein
MIAAAWTYDLLWGCGCSGGGSPSAYFFAQLCLQARPANKQSSKEKEGGDFVENAFPRCRKCSEGDLVPLSDFGSQGASIEYKAWVCTNPSCLYNIKIRNGDIIINEPISDGSLHSYRSNRQ